MTKEPIPVVPAQHYTCGGVVIDLDGRTDLPGLYAVGEVSQSGLHGANRLASNSLLECFVFGDAAATAHRRALGRARRRRRRSAPGTKAGSTDSDEEVVIKQNWTEIRRFMWNYVGIVRTTKRLERAAAPDQAADRGGRGLLRPFPRHPDLIELRNLLQTRRPDRPLRPPPQGEPRAALHARLSEDAGEGGGYGPSA